MGRRRIGLLLRLLMMVFVLHSTPVWAEISAPGAEIFRRREFLTKHGIWKQLTIPSPPAHSDCQAVVGKGETFDGYSGGCKDGKAEGLGEMFSSATDGLFRIYALGEFKKGAPHGEFIVIVTSYPTDYRGLLAFSGTMARGEPAGKGSIWTDEGSSLYRGGVGPGFSLHGRGELRLKSGARERGRWRANAVIRSRYTYPNGDWEILRGITNSQGKVEVQVVRAAYSPPPGTPADCIPGNSVNIRIPGKKGIIQGVVLSRASHGCSVKTNRHGGSTMMVNFKELEVTYTAEQKARDQARSTALRQAYQSVISKPQERDWFAEYIKGQSEIDAKRASQGSWGSRPGYFVDPCDPSTATLSRPPSCR